MAGNCKDVSLGPVLALVAAGGNFSNPVAAVINTTATSAYTVEAALVLAIAGLDPLSPTYATDLANCNNLQAGLHSFAGTSIGGIGTTSVLGQYKAHTDFMSGAVQVFPASILSAYTGAIPNSAVIANFTFTALLGAASGGLGTTSALCLIDPLNPCAVVNAIFNSILGGMAAEFAIINAGLAAMTDLVNSAVAYLAQIVTFADAVRAAITNELTSLVNLIQQGLNFALSKFLKALNLNPCFQSIIEATASTALQDALNA